MTTEQKKLSTPSYGIIVGDAELGQDIALLGLSSDYLRLANSYHLELPQVCELHRVIPLESLFFYNVELFDKEKFPKRKLLKAEIGIGYTYRDKNKRLRLKRVRPIKHYRDTDGWSQSLPEKFLKFHTPETEEKKYPIITSINPTGDQNLFLIQNSVICSLGNGTPEIVPLRNSEFLGMIDDDVRSVSLQDIFSIERNQLSLNTSSLDVTGKNSEVVSNSLRLKSQRTRPTDPQPGTIIYNNRKKAFEGWDGTSWKTLKMED